MDSERVTGRVTNPRRHPSLPIPWTEFITAGFEPGLSLAPVFLASALNMGECRHLKVRKRVSPTLMTLVIESTCC